MEVACNQLFGAGQGSMIAAPDPNRMFSVKKAELVVFNRDVQELLTDFEMMTDIVKVRPQKCLSSSSSNKHWQHAVSIVPQELGEGEQRGYQALFAVNEMVNLCDPSDPTSFLKAHSLAQTFFSQHNGQSQHAIHAMGHCHIDSGSTTSFFPSYRDERKTLSVWICFENVNLK